MRCTRHSHEAGGWNLPSTRRSTPAAINLTAPLRGGGAQRVDSPGSGERLRVVIFAGLSGANHSILFFNQASRDLGFAKELAPSRMAKGQPCDFSYAKQPLSLAITPEQACAPLGGFVLWSGAQILLPFVFPTT
jgi:hypothetical protein